MNPEDGLVTTLVQMWRDVLQDGSLGKDDNFFLAGGHSLVALRLVDRIEAATGRPVELVTLLDNPTPAALASQLDQETRAGR
jgi:aryl carrier-like protein